MQLLDKEALEKAEPLGELSLKLSDLEPGKLLDVWLPLVEDMDNPRAGNAQGEVRDPLPARKMAHGTTILVRKEGRLRRNVLRSFVLFYGPS